MLHLPTVQEHLSEYIDAGFPILYICTYEETSADKYIADAAVNMDILEWNGANCVVNFKTKVPYGPTLSLEAILSVLKRGKEFDRKLLVIKDGTEQLKSPKVIALLKEIARKIHNEEIDAVVIIVSPIIYIPPELEKLITVLELGLPDETEIGNIIKQFAVEQNVSCGPDRFQSEMAVAFKGLTESEIRNLLSLAVSRNGELTNKALKLIFDQKQQIILKADVLEMVPLKESINDIGGLDNLKKWLQSKAAVFKNMKAAEEFGVVMPKGVLIVGVPGCGKSLSAKAAGTLFDVPLLRLDMGRLLGKYVGESEENMRKAIRLAEAISPCVLWVDELEKAFSGIGNSGGGAEVTKRLLGTFLTWMQEKQSPAFVVATANDITQLPPELLRKGRFDEIFYVGLPSEEERKIIFEIHLKKRRSRDLQSIDIDELANKTKGYSGADIEGVVNESVERAFVKGCDRLTTEELLGCIHTTHPLSEIMKEQIEKMDNIYEGKGLKPASKSNKKKV